MKTGSYYNNLDIDDEIHGSHAPSNIPLQQQIPIQQLADIHLLENAISKAERTRNRFHHKLLKDETLKQKTHSSEAVSHRESRDLVQAQVTDTDIAHSPVLSKPVQTESYVAAISQTRLNSLLNQTKTTSSKGLKHTPAHIKAPFQTKQISTRANSIRQCSSGRSRGTLTAVQKSSTRNQERCDRNNCRTISTNSGIKTNMDTKSSVQKRPTSKTINVKPAKASSAHHSESTDPNIQLANAYAERLSTQRGFDEARQPLSSVRITDKDKVNIEDREGKISACNEKPKALTLITDGGCLEVPAKLKKMLSANHRLRIKLRDRNLHQKVTKGNSALEQFLAAVEQHHKTQISAADYSMWEQMTAYSYAYINLTGKLQCISGKSYSEKQGWKNILESRQQLGFILAQYSDMEDNYRKFTQVTSHCQLKDDTLHISPPNSQCLPPWLPSHLLSDIPTMPCTIRYKKRKHLLLYHHLLQEAQVLSLHRHILTLVNTELLQCLKEMKADGSELYEAYRSVYSLLCTGGTVLPALVKDTIEEHEHYDANDF